MMKHCLPLLAILLIATPLSAQLPDSCSAPLLVRHHYLGSAKILALRQMLGDPAWADSVDIPAGLYNPMLEALSAVYNATQYPERDTVTECLDILAFPSPVSPVTLSMTADTSVLWAKKLYFDVFPTGNDTIDHLILQYRLRKTSGFQLSKFFFTFESEEPFNTAALAHLFNTVAGAHAEASGSFGDGNDITLDTAAGGVTLTYRVGFGDCPAGCIFSRAWTFLVRPDCSVEFLGVEGDALNQEVSCSTVFECATEPLCLPWLQDSLLHYTARYPGCFTSDPNLTVTIYQDFNTHPVLGIHVFIGIDAEFTDFFYCSGDYIGTCQLTIGGPGCMPESLSHYIRGDTIWTCAQPLPTPTDCGITAAPAPADPALDFLLAPNPTATGEVMLYADLEVAGPVRVSVFDVFGKMVLEKNLAGGVLNERLKVNGQGAGLYFVRLESGNRSFTQKLLVLP